VDAKSSRKTQKKLVETTGFALAALKVAASLARPVIVEFVKNRLTDFAGKITAAKRKGRNLIAFPWDAPRF